MDAIFGKTFGAVALVVAVVKFAFCVPLYSDDAFESRITRFRRKG